MNSWTLCISLVLLACIATGAWLWTERLDSSSGDVHLKSSSAEPDSRTAWWQSTETPQKTGPEVEVAAADVDALVTAFLEAADASSRAQALDTLVRQMDRQTAPLIERKLREVLGKHPSAQEQFYRAWGALSGREALLVAGTVNQRASRAAIAGWASEDSGAAITFFENLQYSAHNGDGTTNFFSREYLRHGVAEGLARTNLSAAAEFVDDQFLSRQVGDKQVGELIRTVANQAVTTLGPKQALQWASELSDGLRNEALAGIARRQAQIDVRETLNWLDDYDNPFTHEGAAYYHTFNTWLQQENGIEGVRAHIDTLQLESLARNEAISAYAQHTIRTAGADTIPLVESISDPSTRHRVLTETFNTWTRQDPQAASDYLSRVDPSPIRDHAITGLATSIARDDPAAAMAWTDTMSDLELRETAQTLVGLAYLESHHAAAGEWLPESGLSPKILERIENPSTDDLHHMKFLAR